MTISSTSTSTYSPLDLLKKELAKEVSSGAVSSTDQTTLSSALSDIDKALKSDASSSSSSSSSTPPSPDQMKSKIDDLIQSEVSSGKLTSAQATELKNVFANAFAGGPGGAGGASSATSSTDSSSTDSSSSSSSTASDVQDLLKKLLEALKSSNSQTASSYGSSGTTSSSATTAKSLVLDYTT